MESLNASIDIILNRFDKTKTYEILCSHKNLARIKELPTNIKVRSDRYVSDRHLHLFQGAHYIAVFHIKSALEEFREREE